MQKGIVAAVIAAGAWKGQAPAGMSRWRALAPLNGRPMLAYVLDALAQSHASTDIILVGPPELSEAFPGLRRLDSTDRLTSNVLIASQYALGKGQLLLVGSDIPLLTPAAIDGFIERCGRPAVQFFYSIIDKPTVVGQYPQMRRTFVRLSDGVYTGGNLMLADPQFLVDREAKIQALYAARKKPAALARFLGWEVFARLLLTHFLGLPLLDVARAERLVGRALEGTVAGVPIPYPEVGADLDSLEEIPVYQEILAKSGKG